MGCLTIANLLEFTASEATGNGFESSQLVCVVAEGTETREDKIIEDITACVCVCVWFYYTPFSAKPEESPIYNREFGHI